MNEGLLTVDKSSASVPLDGILISQRNIGYQEWAVQFTNVSKDIVESGFVGQINPAILYYNEFNLALTNQALQDVLLTDAQQSGTSVIDLLPAIIAFVTGITPNS